MRILSASLLVLAMCVCVEPAHAHEWRHGIHFYATPLCVGGGSGGWYGPGFGFGGGALVSPWWNSSVFVGNGIPYYGYSNYGYSSWGYGPFFGPSVVSQPVIVPASPRVVVVNAAPAVPQPTVARPPRPPVVAAPPAGPNVFDVMQQHAERRENVPVVADDSATTRPISASSRAGKARSQQFQAEGDRWLREGQFVKAYLRYLEAQREAEDRGDVYFRQAFALVAMGRYSHAVMKLKRGLQVDPAWPQHGESLDTIYGVSNVVEKTEYLQRVADWATHDVRDPDRLFLMGVLLYFDEDPRSGDFFRAAWKVAGRGDHLQSFWKRFAEADAKNIRLSQTAPVADARRVIEPRSELRPPPRPPQEELPADHRLRVPKFEVPVPPEPAPRELNLPDVVR